MTTAGPGSMPTALDLLFGTDAAAAKALAGEILSPGGDQSLNRAIAHLSEATRQAAAQEAATTMAALLKVDLIGVLVRGWSEHRNIIGAAQRTLAAPGSTELVSMSSHEVKLDQRPSVSVLVDGQQVATLQFGLSIVFDVNALLLGISGGGSSPSALVAAKSPRPWPPRVATCSSGILTSNCPGSSRCGGDSGSCPSTRTQPAKAYRANSRQANPPRAGTRTPGEQVPVGDGQPFGALLVELEPGPSVRSAGI